MWIFTFEPGFRSECLWSLRVVACGWSGPVRSGRGSDPGLVQVVVEGGLDGSEGLADRQGRGWLVGGEERAQQLVADLGVAGGEPDAVRGVSRWVLLAPMRSMSPFRRGLRGS
jgi:hypothetical protein